MLSHFELLLDLRLEGRGHKVGLLDNLHIVFGWESLRVGQLVLNFLGLIWCGSSEIVTFGDKDRALALLLGCRRALTLYVGERLLDVWIFIVNFGISLGSCSTLQIFFGTGLLLHITLVEVLALVEEFVFDLLHDVTWQVYNLTKG